MFKRLSALLLVLAMLLPAALCEDKPRRKLTLMIYVCGSNLESSYGSASSDLQEMIDSGGPGEDVSVLVMTGGTRYWAMGYDPAECQIQELRRRGLRTVWRNDAASMGASATLTALLRYGMENRPADDYALILWDHGGGPLEGVCWDELFSLDHLTLEELQQGIEDAGLGRKLSFIGFDACLMGSLEVASALAPYADYMIASQETEPAAGWNYSFLPGLSEDLTPVDTARRIVDGYMEAQVLQGETLTLACLDLAKVRDAVNALGDCFAAKANDMSADKFVELAGERAQTAGFGAPLKAFGEGGYDMVDLKDLTQQMDPSDAAGQKLLSALSDLVAYSRSNREGANGVSVYHPCFNKDKYRSAWRSDYKKLDFSDAYTRYIESYGRYLLGDELTDWSGLEVAAGGMEEGSQTFSVKLSKDQMKNLASAHLIVMMSTQYVIATEDVSYSLLGTYPAALDEDGTLTATYDGRALFLEADESCGPLAYTLSQDGNLVTWATYIPKEGGLGSEDSPNVYYYVNEDAEIAQIRLEDPATGMLTNRAAFSEDNYRGMYLWYPLKDMPEPNAQGLLPEYALWDDSRDSLMWNTVTLPADWHFAIRSGVSEGNALYAAFELTDVQQNTWCTPLVPVENPTLQPLTLEQSEFEVLDTRLSVAATLDATSGKPGLWLEFQLDNEGAARNFSLAGLMLNGIRDPGVTASIYDADDPTAFTVNRRGRLVLFIEQKDLLGLGRLDTIDFDLKAEIDYSDVGSAPVALRFVDADVSAIAPEPEVMASASVNGLEWELLSLRREFAKLRMLLRVRNTGVEVSALDPVHYLINENIQLCEKQYFSPPGPGQEGVFEVNAYTREYWDDNWDDFRLGDTDDDIVEYVLPDVLESRGITEIDEVSVVFGRIGTLPSGSTGAIVRLPLKAPFPLPEKAPPSTDLLTSIRTLCEDGAQPRLLAEGGGLRVWIDHLLAGENALGMTLTVENTADQLLTLSIDEAEIDGRKVQVGHWSYETDHNIAPHATASVACTFGTLDDLPRDLPVGTVRLSMRCDYADPAAATLTCPPGTALSAPGGIILPAEALQIDPAQMPAP